MGVCSLVMQMMTNVGSGSVGTSINVAGSKETQVFLSHWKWKQQAQRWALVESWIF